MSALDELNLFEKNNQLEKELREEKKKSENVQRELYRVKYKKNAITMGVASFITIISIAAGSMAHSLYSNYKMIREGKDVITQNVYENCMDGIGWRDYSDGIRFNIGSNYVEYDEVLSTLKSRARASEISDIDLYIGISDILNKDFAEDLVGEINQDEVNARAYEVYLSEELERVRDNGK